MLKKIEKFLLDCINKQFEIVGSSFHWDTFDELKSWTEDNKEFPWYDTYSFNTIAQYQAFKEFFFEHYKNNMGRKRTAKYKLEREFSFFMLNYGFREAYRENNNIC